MMFIINWIRRTLSSFGWLNKEARIVFLGLDNAGKTTLLRMLKDNRVAIHTPTLHPHSEQLTLEKVNVTAFDLGGHETARRVWKQYCGNVDAIVFIVDASDRTRFQESAEELKSLLNEEELSNKPFVILGNKIDKQGAASEEELRMHLSLYANETYGKNCRPGRCVRPVEVFMCSIIKKQGYGEAFRWLSHFLQDA
ncbi:ADP-ribosylation factor family member protein [Theileria equi strain WA]|uniref:ADP-ribosylation factor family member protein n=1 Tax=Theileria equi strain WA TaxID=1537102 RepID=L0B299_THEEQ|nr:ADP-ribosylation factor family member protein [Theileria equi strain WA]AFZ81361.1 ADP-ribosylation factor family member protein [Theileria equi strain WA]|eukprot:XP_004831027.1 ADP-ribosylation factor family member protein [Theileria equi strain WA]